MKIRFLNNLKEYQKLWHRFLYLLGTIIFLFLFSLLYGKFQSGMMQTLTTHNNLFIEQVSTISSSLLNNIKSSAMQMFYTTSIRKLRTKEVLSNAEITRGLRDLGNFVSTSDFLDSVMIYNSNSDMVFTSESDRPSVKREDFHDQIAVDILTHPESYPYLSPIRREYDGGRTWSFLFFEHTKNSSSVLLLNVNEDWFTSHLLGISEDIEVIVINESGDIIASKSEELNRTFQNSWLDLQKQLLKKPSNGYLTQPVFSSAPGWVYHNIAHTSWYYLRPISLETTIPGLWYIRNILLISLFIISIFFIGFVSWVILVIYKPLLKIKNVLNSHEESATTISLKVEELVSEHQKDSFRKELFQLHNGILPNEFKFPILLVQARHISVERLYTILENSHLPVLLSSTENIVDFAISNCDLEFLDSLNEQLYSENASSFYISNLCLSEEDLRTSSQALEELRLLHVLYPDRHILSEKLLSECNSISSLNSKDVSSMITSLKNGDSDTAYQQWLYIFERIRHDRYTEFCFSIQYIEKQLLFLANNLSVDLPWNNDSLVLELTDIYSFNSLLKRTFDLLSTVVLQKKHEQLIALSKQVNEYIELHFNEPNFSVQEVADYFQMNAAYLSRQYKKTSEISITDAIHQLRIKQACFLLENTDEPVEYIAEKIGYSNNKYFFVLFKKWIGNTPTQYRISVRENNSCK